MVYPHHWFITKTEKLRPVCWHRFIISARPRANARAGSILSTASLASLYSVRRRMCLPTTVSVLFAVVEKNIVCRHIIRP